jgi:uncharacterized membrane protein YeaQ/YmgE (transglycosylase-associated protein family)
VFAASPLLKEYKKWVSWIILGLIAGFIGSQIVNRQGQGLWLDIALGTIGALVGGFFFDLFGVSGVSGLNNLQHDRRSRGFSRGAFDLQCSGWTPPSIMQQQNHNNSKPMGGCGWSRRHMLVFAGLRDCSRDSPPYAEPARVTP